MTRPAARIASVVCVAANDAKGRKRKFYLSATSVDRACGRSRRGLSSGMGPLELTLSSGVMVAVPASLQSISTYVLLEQESWFERELGFLRQWLQPGMTAIDIGANLGVYTLPISRWIGPTGHVFAYEPGSEARELLEISSTLNHADNLHISPCALSDSEREGRLTLGISSELNMLGEDGAGERVRITSLDIEDAERGWSPDFVKIDAEGEEERIVAGGRAFFVRHSPLVMFEVKAGDKTNERLRALFPSIGYSVFRQLGAAPILIPDDLKQSLDEYELNLFAAKPDRVNELSRRGYLVETLPVWSCSPETRKNGEAFWRSQQFASLTRSCGDILDQGDLDYRDGFAAFAAWRDPDQPVAARCAALQYALRNLRVTCTNQPSATRLSTLARAAWEWGARRESVAVLQRLLQSLQNGQIRLYDQEPFWLANSRFDRIAIEGPLAFWLAAAGAEQFETGAAHSSIFSGGTEILGWLCEQPIALTEFVRRRVLLAARAGRRPPIPDRLRRPASDHLNAEIWRAGKVPGTVV